MSRSEQTPAERIREKAAAMRARGQDWAFIAKALNAEGHRTTKGKPFAPLTAFKLVERTSRKVAKPSGPVGQPESLRLALARAAATTTAGTPEERLEAVRSFLQ